MMTKVKWVVIVLVVLAILITVGISAFWSYQQTIYYQKNGSIGGPNNCKPGHPCVIEEDEGKKKVSDTPEVQALAKKYGGWEYVHIGALEIDLVRHTTFIEKIYPNLAEETGCIIIVFAGDEGYIYREDKNLNIVYQETIAEFIDRTKDIDPDFMAKFYLSLR